MGAHAANPAILLNDFFHRVIDDTLNPFFLDHGAVWALMHRMEVLGEFHSDSLPDTVIS